MTTRTNLLDFDAFSVSLSVIRELHTLVGRVHSHDASLATQLRKAASSVALNVAEGRRRAGRDRKHLWRVAAGSAEEVRACLYVAEGWQYLGGEDIQAALDGLDRVLAMLWRMTR